MIELPEDIVEHIISFTCDRRGYNMNKYNARKKINLPRITRINKEILYFYSMGLSVSWLRGSKVQNKKKEAFKKSLKNGNAEITYHIGCYTCFYNENMTRKRSQKSIHSNN